MEKVVEHAIIIEFNGLPGSGKSTLVELINKEAPQRGWQVITDYEKNKGGRSLFSLLKNPSNILFFLELLHFGRLTKKCVGQILRCIDYINSYKKIKGKTLKSTMLILDEGVIQTIVSIAYLESFRGKEASLNRFFSCLKKKNVCWYSINFINEPQVSYDRIIQRGANLGRMDKMNKNELTDALNIQNESFDIVRNEACKSGAVISSISIDTKKAPGFNSSIIMDWLMNVKVCQ